ncbi:hypothetical protein K438DRAFT_2025235, partial [Mycena galopus ATCC 62051]
MTWQAAKGKAKASLSSYCLFLHMHPLIFPRLHCLPPASHAGSLLPGFRFCRQTRRQHFVAFISVYGFLQWLLPSDSLSTPLQTHLLRKHLFPILWPDVHVSPTHGTSSKHAWTLAPPSV